MVYKPLFAISGPKKGIPSLAAACLQHWAVLLSAYSYLIDYKPTGKHCNADALPRLHLPEFDSIPMSTVPSCFQIQSLPITSDAVQNANH